MCGPAQTWLPLALSFQSSLKAILNPDHEAQARVPQAEEPEAAFPSLNGPSCKPPVFIGRY